MNQVATAIIGVAIASFMKGVTDFISVNSK